MKKLFLVIGMLAMLMGRQLPAQNPTPNAAGAWKPVGIVSISGYDEVLNDVNYLGKLAENPNLSRATIEGILAAFTQGQGLKGLDTKRPWGAALTTDGTQFKPLIFLPVTSLKQLLTGLAGMLGEPKDVGGGVFELSAPNNPQKVYAKEQTGWAFIAQTPDGLKTLPADPVKLLDGLEKQYDIAVRVNVQNIPEQYRSMAIDQLKQSIQASLEKRPDEEDDDYELRKQAGEMQLANIVQALTETSQLTLGWMLDEKAGSALLDVSVTAVAGSSLAKKFSGMTESPSNFSAFTSPLFAVNLSSIGTISPDDIKSYQPMFKSVRARLMKELEESTDLPDEDAKKQAKEGVGQLMDAIDATVKAGKTDIGASVQLDAKSLTFVAGATVADGTAIESALKKIATAAEKDEDFPKIKWNADKHAGVRFHTLTVPVEDDNAEKVLGETFDVTIGIGPKAVYVAGGKENLLALKTAIDKSASEGAKKIVPSQVQFALTPILRFADSISEDSKIEQAAAELAKAPSKDHVTFTTKPSKNGGMVRLTVEEGVLKVIGKMSNAKNSQQAGARQPAAPRAVPVPAN